MVSRKKALLIGSFVVGITALVCGTIVFHTWKETQETFRSEMTEEAKQDVEDNPIVTEEPVATEEVTDTEMIAQDTQMQPEPTSIARNEDELMILQQPECYTYKQMEEDLFLLPEIYGEIVQVDSLGETVDGRQMYHVTIGNAEAEKKIFINAGIHAREYITSHLVMHQVVSFLGHVKAGDSYQGYTYQQLLEQVQIHVVPMVNPDGISISQLGMDGIQKEEVKQKIQKIASLDGTAAEGNYLVRWKANANGVDLNRNFDALWSQYQGTGHPSTDKYKGEAVGCEVESAAMIALTEKEQFDRTISYHSQGSVIYWYFAQEGTLYEETLRFGERISNLTGYPLDANYQYLDPAGYKDWAICGMEIPSLTIEVGWDTSPVPFSQYEDIWSRNQYVWEETLLDIM